MTTNDKVLVPRELLPCPFCGSEDVGIVEIIDSEGDMSIAVGCHSCLCNGTPHIPLMDDARPAAISSWNHRVSTNNPDICDVVLDPCSICPECKQRLHVDRCDMLAAAPQLTEDGLPKLPEAGRYYDLSDVPCRAYTADQMLAFRAEGIAFAQQRGAAVVVDEAFDVWLARNYPLYQINSIVTQRMRDAWNAALTAALNREEG